MNPASDIIQGRYTQKNAARSGQATLVRGVAQPAVYPSRWDWKRLLASPGGENSLTKDSPPRTLIGSETNDNSFQCQSAQHGRQS